MIRTSLVCLTAVVALLTGCGSDPGSDGSSRLSAAANRVEPQLRSSWSASFAGLELDPDHDRLIVYRRPDPALDAAVRAETGEVDVEFRDAPYALDVLQPLADRVDADRNHWSRQGITVTTVAPRADGTGVQVTVAASALGAARTAFPQRYGDEPVLVAGPEPGGIQPAAVPARPSPGSSASRKAAIAG